MATDQSPQNLASSAMDAFENALRNTPAVSPAESRYADSAYSHLLEAMILAFMAEDAFIYKRWRMDVHSVLRRWLPPEVCQPFFAGDREFVHQFRQELGARGKSHIKSGDLKSHYLLLEKGIADSGGGTPFID